MTQFGDVYSQYYDLLYSDKNYQQEVDYVVALINAYSKHAKTILDMGCGTGKHAEQLSDKGFIVQGIDLSEEMLKIAKTRIKNERLSFYQGDIGNLNLNLNQKFDVIVSLFHVISYQTTNLQLINVFENIKRHLNQNGIAIFDFWYGPAVLTDLPAIRIKRLENHAIRITRLAEPTLYVTKNTVDVNYDIFIEDKKNKNFVEKKELHQMRYFFDLELELICNQMGFFIEKKLVWMTFDVPSIKSWNVVWVIRK